MEKILTTIKSSHFIGYKLVESLLSAISHQLSADFRNRSSSFVKFAVRNLQEVSFIIISSLWTQGSQNFQWTTILIKNFIYVNNFYVWSRDFRPGRPLYKCCFYVIISSIFFKIHWTSFIKFSEFFSFSQQIHCRANFKLFGNALRIISALKAVVAITITVFVPENNYSLINF